MNTKNVVSSEPGMNIQVTNLKQSCSLSEMLDAVDKQLDFCLERQERFLHHIIVDFVGLAPRFFHAQHTVGEKADCAASVVEPIFVADDGMPPEIPTLEKMCGMIKEDVKLDFKKGTVRTRKSPRHAKDCQLGMWSLTPNEIGDDWIISVEVPGYMQRAELTFSDVFASSPNTTAFPAVSPTLLALPSLPSTPSFNSCGSSEPSDCFSPMLSTLMVPALSPQTSLSSLCSELDSYISLDEILALEVYE